MNTRDAETAEFLRTPEKTCIKLVSTLQDTSSPVLMSTLKGRPAEFQEDITSPLSQYTEFVGL
jgi:hypothetical protein